MIWNREGIVVWRRKSHPLMLISLKNFITKPNLPPNLPPNDRLRWLILFKGVYHIRMRKPVCL